MVHLEDYDMDMESDAGESAMTNSNVKEPKEKEVIAHKESCSVFGMKLRVLFALVGAAIGAMLLVHFHTSNSEKSQVEEQCSEFSDKVLESIGMTLDTTFGAVDVLVMSIVSHARSTGQTWPNVTIPDFAYRAAKILPLSKCLMLRQMHVVTPEDHAGWEAYTIKNAMPRSQRH